MHKVTSSDILATVAYLSDLWCDDRWLALAPIYPGYNEKVHNAWRNLKVSLTKAIKLGVSNNDLYIVAEQIVKLISQFSPTVEKEINGYEYSPIQELTISVLNELAAHCEYVYEQRKMLLHDECQRRWTAA